MSARLLATTSGAVGFGVVDALAWGRGSQAWFWVANTSSAYLLLAFAAGAVVTRARPGGRAGGRVVGGRLAAVGLRAAAAGVLATLLALAAFYAVLLATRQMSAATVVAPLLRYAVPGVATGVVFGALGGWWAQRRSWWALGLVAAAFVVEPLAWRVHLGFLPTPAVWAGEAAAGGLLAVVAVVVSVRARTQEPPLG